MIGKAELSVVGIKPKETEKLFDQKTINKGIHLRWNFNPEMGFPENGFLIKRYNKVFNPQTVNNFDDVIEKQWVINLTQTKARALNRLSNRSSSQIRFRSTLFLAGIRKLPTLQAIADE